MSFMHQYMQHHSMMTQWFQQLHGNIPMAPLQAVSSTENLCHFCHQRTATMCNSCQQQHFRKTRSKQPISEDNSNDSSSEASRSESPYSECLEEELALSDGSVSEYELEFNVDAIMAMRAAKKENSSKEEFEFVELESKNDMNYEDLSAGNDFQLKKEMMQVWYGDAFSTIAGLETAMNINIQRICDINQPPKWPCLPLLSLKNV
ncbi:gem-associated protein 8-like [Stegodyphus dumicola]|uniref:gem-associated protein 8-like n=1 Tax=Stegodyphus dumicola TaxID=202533 RepID=UPI0015A862F4|nr:gem-associated protein 8-like [Stegodyphus dumicola]XP_035214994.1 gem-associated protein 8-like [Stegodyphus dumicola]